MGVHTTDREQKKRGSTVLDLIGNTPLLRLRKFEAGLDGVELYGKAEWFNPGGSVKDRPAVEYGARGAAIRRAAPGKDAARRDIRQHRHRVRDDRRGPGLPGEIVRALECHR